jgi:hypothetical protein
LGLRGWCWRLGGAAAAGSGATDGTDAQAAASMACMVRDGSISLAAARCRPRLGPAKLRGPRPAAHRSV